MARRDGERERIVALVKGTAMALAELYPDVVSGQVEGNDAGSTLAADPDREAA
jgi:hypothetical protein